MKEESTLIIRLVFLALVVGMVAGLYMANYQFVQQNPGGNDFMARWSGARFWVMEGISPYDPQVSLASQQAIYGRPADVSRGEDIAHFVYPLHSMLFFAPFGLFEFPVARALWMTLLEICLVLLGVVSLRLADWRVSPYRVAVLLLFSLFWYHGARTVIIGQFAGLNALLITMALYLIQKKQDFAAGVLLALSTAKPQMAYLLLPFVFLWAISVRRRDIIGGMLITGGLLLAATLLLLPGWPLQWLGQLMDYPNYTSKIGSVLSTVANTMPGLSGSLSPFLHAVAYLYLLVEWVLAWGKEERWFIWTALLTIVITNLAAYRTATTNFVMMLPVLFVIFRTWEARWKRAGKLGVWLSLIFLSIGLWGLFLSTVQGNEEAAIMYIPLPFLCLFGLWWVRWWFIRPPRVLVDEIIERFK